MNMTKVSASSSTSLDPLQPGPTTPDRRRRAAGPAGAGEPGAQGAKRVRGEPAEMRTMRFRPGGWQSHAPTPRMARCQGSSPCPFPMPRSPDAAPCRKALQEAEWKLMEQHELVLSLQEALWAHAEAGPGWPTGQPALAPVLQGVPPADAALVRAFRQAATPARATDEQLKSVDASCMTLERLSVGLAASKVQGGLEALRQQTADERKQTLLDALRALARLIPGVPPVPLNVVDRVAATMQTMFKCLQQAPAAHPPARPS